METHLTGQYKNKNNISFQGTTERESAMRIFNLHRAFRYRWMIPNHTWRVGNPLIDLGSSNYVTSRYKQDHVGNKS